ncbi:uncharacterized protein LOC131998188 isoform X2 [Stomoxys calcitrans]|uniref:uncharacterized protein LOC131998188 isoform X2 n=1 Tax=Stomoxys calcitrans TaxID=35570 RepID=UPI0027E364D3|nr:uncharacterized protein LOC131998188 isoform X2 [Stomoxys calcitrans]
MSVENSKKVFALENILERIFKYLPLKDQFRLAQVCSATQNVFDKYILPIDYRHLKIKAHRVYNLVYNGGEMNRLVLSPNELKEFLGYYAACVEELSADELMDYRPFTKLKALCIDGAHISLDVIKQIAAQKPQLSTLKVTHRSPEGFATLLENLPKMKNLRELELKLWKGYISNNECQLIFKLLSELKLEVFKFGDTSLRTNWDAEQVYQPNCWKSLKVLDVQLSCLEAFLDKASGVKSLTLRGCQTCDKEISVYRLGYSFPQLEVLNLSCIPYSNYNSFILHRSLKELNFIRSTLTFNHMKEILSLKHNLRKLTIDLPYSSKEVRIYLRKFPLPHAIETLVLEENISRNWIQLDGHSEHLNNLTFNDAEQLVLDLIPNLKTLIMDPSDSEISAFCNLKYLQKLEIRLDSIEKWEKVETLLKIPSLKELKMKFLHSCWDRIPCCPNLRTNITTLTLCYCKGNYEEDLNVWLELLNQNPKIKMVFQTFFYERHIISHIIGHPRFPAFLTSIYVAGVQMDLKFLKKYCREKSFEELLSHICMEEHHHEIPIILWKKGMTMANTDCFTASSKLDCPKLTRKALETNRFSAAEKHLLESEIRSNKLIWDETHPKYCNTDALKAAWQEISATLGKPVSACKSEWRSLQDAKRYHKNKNRKSGDDGGKVLDKPLIEDDNTNYWEFRDAMSFWPTSCKIPRISKHGLNDDSSRAKNENMSAGCSSVSYTKPSNAASNPSDMKDAIENRIADRNEKGVKNYEIAGPFKYDIVCKNFDRMLQKIPEEEFEGTVHEINTLLYKRIKGIL